MPTNGGNHIEYEPIDPHLQLEPLHDACQALRLELDFTLWTRTADLPDVDGFVRRSGLMCGWWGGPHEDAQVDQQVRRHPS